MGNPVDISTGQGAEEGGERGGAKAAVKKWAWGRQRREKSAVLVGVGGMGMGGTEKCHKSEEGDLEPVRKGRVEEADSKTETEVGVKRAKPLGRRRGDRPTRECERA